MRYLRTLNILRNVKMKNRNPIVTLFSVVLLLGVTSLTHAASEKNKQIDELARSIFANHRAGGVVLVRKGDEVIYREAFGLADIEHNVKMRPDSVMKLASVTKQFSAMAVMQLIEANKLRFEDTLGDIIDGYPAVGENVTIRQLLNQVSGIKNISRIQASRDARPLDKTVDELIAYFSELPLEFPSGTQWQYSNSNYILLTKVIEVTSGESYGDYMKKHIFEPLNMVNTQYGSRFPIIANRARGYRMKDGELENANYISMTQPQGAGALLSTIDDLNLWDQALQSEKLVSEEMFELASTPVELTDGQTFMYGLGWLLPKIRGVQSMEHNGGIDGFFSQVIRVPEHNVYVAVISNAEHINSQLIAEEIAAIVIGLPVKRIQSKQSDLEMYVGEYDFGNGQVRTISAVDGFLYEQINNGNKSKLSHAGSDQFYYDLGLNYVTFENNNENGEMVFNHRYGGPTAGVKKLEAQ